MFSRRFTTLTLAALRLTTVTAVTAVTAVTTNKDAVDLCNGVTQRVVRCITDVSYTLCLPEGDGHGLEQVYFVSAGTHCEQGTTDQHIDTANVPGVATATRVFQQPAAPNAPNTLNAPSTNTASTKAPLVGSANDDQKASWFMTIATAGLPAPTLKYVEDFATVIPTSTKH